MQIGILGRAEWLVNATARCQRYHRHCFEHRSSLSNVALTNMRKRSASSRVIAGNLAARSLSLRERSFVALPEKGAWAR